MGMRLILPTGMSFGEKGRIFYGKILGSKNIDQSCKNIKALKTGKNGRKTGLTKEGKNELVRPKRGKK